MNLPSILDQFQGFLDTPDMHNSRQKNLEAFNFPEINITNELVQDLEALDHPRNSVLGKRMESFFEIAIKHSTRYQLIASNIQVIEEKRTLGELDFLLFDKLTSRPLHVELVYKLYVYDLGFSSEDQGWIGPNRRDSYLEKIDKLKEKQFPLLYRPETLEYLKQLDLSPESVEQQLCFKAQLYSPGSYSTGILKKNNSNCLKGNWYKLEEFLKMEWNENLFLSPPKKFWSCDPAKNSSWISYSELIDEINLMFEKKKAPMVWMKTSSGYYRFFIVWW
ncbi:DUF1853 family protein [Gramella lutea]|uniref:DUF1853 family protein n=1 Tax=Christiangramia lutea TaxID=1607951 RepID=A0A9X1V2J6_9FLAO|nr:DUF1853 family protein [Christiangramia lutea]MCH4823222.1 DUF1853 family protein [Christiangramia lutea]